MRGKRKAREITPEYLQRVALYHLQRFASSSENLRRVLLRRVQRSLRELGGDRDEMEEMVDAVIVRYIECGLLDDRTYATQRAQRLHRAGRAIRAIRADLTSKGLGNDDIAAGLSALGGSADADLEAAAKYVRKRKLGPFRSPEVREEHRQRDYAALARRGFSFEVARRVVLADSPEALQAMLDERCAHPTDW